MVILIPCGSVLRQSLDISKEQELLRMAINFCPTAILITFVPCLSMIWRGTTPQWVKIKKIGLTKIILCHAFSHGVLTDRGWYLNLFGVVTYKILF